MIDKELARDLKRNKPVGSRGRSNLYRYILDNWSQLRAAGYGTADGPTWQELTGRLARRGQVNARGGLLKKRKVAELFLRVQAEVLAKEMQRRTGVAAKPQVARAQADWRPPVVERAPTPNASPASPLSPFAPAASSTASADPSHMTPEERKADLRRVINERSGR